MIIIKYKMEHFEIDFSDYYKKKFIELLRYLDFI